MRRLSSYTSVRLRHFCAGVLLGVVIALIKAASRQDHNPQELPPFHKAAAVTEESHLSDRIVKREAKNSTVMCIFYKKKITKIQHQLHIARHSWTNKCTSMLLFIDRYNGTIPALSFDRLPYWVNRSPSNFITALRYVYGRHFHEADWFFISRGIPYVIMENLRHFLSRQDTGKPVYWGHKLKKKAFGTDVIYPDDFSGIVVSKQALRRLESKGKYNRFCNGLETTEGVMFAMCMASLGIQFGDARDGEGRSRFLLHSPGSYLEDNLPPTPWLEDVELESSRVRGGGGYRMKNVI